MRPNASISRWIAEPWILGIIQMVCTISLLTFRRASPPGGETGSPEPRPVDCTFLLPTSTLHTDTYTKRVTTGRPPSNPPLNANGSAAFAAPRWNPASLLNPRGMQHQPQRSVQNGFTNNAAPQQPLMFQFDSPGGQPQPQPSYHAHPPQQPAMNGNKGFAGYANGGGMGHMLERMHQVTDRDMMPQKRQKIRDDRQEDGRKAEFNGGGKGGVIGEYMREKRDEGRKENVTKGTVVDISAG